MKNIFEISLTHTVPYSLKLWAAAFALFIITAPGDGRAAFVPVHIGIADDTYRLLRYILSVFYVTWAFGSRNNIAVHDYVRGCVVGGLPVFLGVLFSSDRSWAFTQALVFSTTLFSAAATVVVFGRFTFHVLARVALLIPVASFLVSVFFPDVGVVSAFQIEQIGSVGDPGSWVGLYTSKNALGHTVGICASILFMSDSQIITAKKRIFGLMCSALCLWNASSGTGIVLAFMGIFLWIIRGNILEASVQIKILWLIFFSFVALFFEPISTLIFDFLGKDATFTGRDEIWLYALDLYRGGNMVVGRGYGFTWGADFTIEMMATFGLNHVHSAYLDLLINLGFFSAVSIILPAVFIVSRLSGSFGRQSYWQFTLYAILIVSGITEPFLARPSGLLPLTYAVLVISALRDKP